jgi:aminopeptidase N
MLWPLRGVRARWANQRIIAVTPRQSRCRSGRNLVFSVAGLVLGLTVGALWTTPGYSDTYPRQKGIDVLHYNFRVTLYDDTDEIEGVASIDVQFLEAGLKELTLDLASQASGKGMLVTNVTSQDKPVTFEHKNDRLRLQLAAPASPGQKVTYQVAYHGIPRSGLRTGKNRHGERTFFSENWPDKARQWLPMLDHPYDKATSEFLITAPAQYQVVSGGLLETETDLGNGRRLTHWKQSVPIASWLNAIGVAQFASHHAGSVKGVPLETWVYHQDGDRVTPLLEGSARRVLEFYTERVGAYPYQKLAGVQAAGVSGGTEHASAIFYGENNVTGRGVTNLVAHEVAHQWFGDSVTEKDWDDVWLSEGFATYFTLLFVEHDSGRAAFLDGLDRSRNIVFAAEKRNPALAVVHDNLSDTKRVLNALVYQKGGWTLHMLRGILGTEPFWAGIREYYRRYRDRNASTAEFQRVMEETSGKDLAWFFRQWLYRAGSPELSGSWHYTPERKVIEIELSQVQPGDPYRLPLEFGIAAEGRAEPRIEKVEIKDRQTKFEIHADTAPKTVTIDPNRSTLAKTTFAERALTP